MTAITIPNTFLPSTTISSTAMNQNFDEVADAIEASVALDGSDTMTGVLRLANGSATNPSLTFGSDLNLGIYRKTTDELAFTTAGALAAHIDAAGKFWLATDLDVADDADIGGDATIDGTLTVTGATALSTLELGHASDTTLSRLGAGSVGVEGTALLRASQNLGDLASAATAFANIKQAASDGSSGVAEIATQAEQETGTDVLRIVTPGRQHFHQSAAKAWIDFEQEGTQSDLLSYNVSSIADAGGGLTTINWGTDFSSANYAIAGFARSSASGNNGAFLTQDANSPKSASACTVTAGSPSGGSPDSGDCGVVAFGDFA